VTLAAGTRLGPYEILAPIGVGGMGEVYKSRDTRLDRTVAIKILPESLAADPQFRDRFDREARTISQLDHPHICTLYDVGEQDGTSFLVMQYLEGETLEARLKKGALPLDQALQYAIQIADALATAHKPGIVHRDLKPGNVMLTKSGAKLLDFGLAKTGAPVIGGAGLSMLPTSPPITQQGSILGTFQYMAPEQLEGQEADARTDIFAFGAVAYEMITGKKAFDGKSQASLIGAIMHAEPTPISTLQPLAPPSLDHVVKRCLAKEPDNRWQSASDVKAALELVTAGTWTAADSFPQTQRLPHIWLLWAVAAGVTLALAVLAFVHFRETQAEPRTVRFQISPPGSTPNMMFKVSPDGRYLAFIAPDGGTDRLWIRALDSLEQRALPATDGASYPFWSPNSGDLGFFAQGKLRRIAIVGGPSRTLCNASSGRGGTWGQDGQIVFAPDANTVLYQVAADGGTPTQVAKLALSGGPTDSLRYPEFLPGSRRFFYVNLSDKPEVAGLYVGSLDGITPTRLLPDVSQAAYVPPTAPHASGYLLFRRETTLMVQPFDPEHLKAIGEMLPLADQIPNARSIGSAAFSASRNGVLVYRSGLGFSKRELVWRDRNGRQGDRVTKAENISVMNLSPDETKVAYSIRQGVMTGDIWLQDLAGGTPSRFWFGPDQPWGGLVWSPNSTNVAFSTLKVEGPRFELYQKSASGAGKEEVLLHTGINTFATDWSRDGQLIVYSQTGDKTGDDLWLLPVDENGKPGKPNKYLQTPSNEIQGQFSPDGHWMAYASDEFGQFQVYVQPIPANGAPRQISTAGGSQPRWRRDGKELFYVAAGGKLMAVAVKIDANFEKGSEQVVFEGIPPEGPRNFTYQPSADGQKFLVNAPAGGDAAASEPLTVVVNWQEELKQRVPSK
jgi:serine/threonine protein kinase